MYSIDFDKDLVKGVKLIDINTLNPHEEIIEKKKTSLAKFIKSYENLLHLNGNLVDVIIHNNDMEKFLDIHKEKFDNLALEYIKKMKTYEQSNSI